LLTSLVSNGQVDKIKIQKESPDKQKKEEKDSSVFLKRSWNICYGQKFLANTAFNGALNDLNEKEIGTPITFVGIAYTSRVLINRGVLNHDGSMYYTQVVPKKIKINDSINANITGFNFGFTIYGRDLFRKQKNFDVIIGIGANTGRLRFYGNSYVTQKNPYFSPKLLITPRLIFGSFCFQINIDYDYDISSKNWRKTNFSDSPKINLPQTSNSGLTVLVGIGYIIKERPYKPVPDEIEY
jgi:hypothetical protein